MIEYTRRLGVAASFERPALPVNRHHKPTKSLHHAGARSFATSVTVSCAVCKSSHAVENCPRSAVEKSMDLEKRCETVKKCKLCLRCLWSGHQGRDCSNTARITVCFISHPVSTRQKLSPAQMRSRLTAISPEPLVNETLAANCFQSFPFVVSWTSRQHVCVPLSGQ